MSPYLTIAEAAELARVSPKRLRNLISEGLLKPGLHHVRPRGLGRRIKRDAFMAWLDNAEPVSHEIPMAHSRRRRFRKG